MLNYQRVLKRKWVDLLLKLVPPTLIGMMRFSQRSETNIYSRWSENLVGRSRAYTSGNQTWQPKVLYTWCLNDLNGKIIELHGGFSSKPCGKKKPDARQRVTPCKAWGYVGWIEATHQSSCEKSPCWRNHLTRPGKLTKNYWKWPSRNSWFTL